MTISNDRTPGALVMESSTHPSDEENGYSALLIGPQVIIDLRVSVIMWRWNVRTFGEAFTIVMWTSSGLIDDVGMAIERETNWRGYHQPLDIRHHFSKSRVFSCPWKEAMNEDRS